MRSSSPPCWAGRITDTRTLYLILGVGLGIVSIIPPLVVFSITRESPADELPKPLPLGEALRQTLSNQPFRMVMGLYLLSWTTASIMAAVLIYFANYYLRVPEQANYFVLAAQGSAILFIPVIVKISQRLDKRRAFIIGSLTWVIVLLGISALRADQVGLAYLFAALAGFGIATAYVVPWSMVPDVVEYDELRSGTAPRGIVLRLRLLLPETGDGCRIMGNGTGARADRLPHPRSFWTFAYPAPGGRERHPDFYRPHPGGAVVLGHALRLEISHHPRKPPGHLAGAG